MLWSTDKLDMHTPGLSEPQGARTPGLPEPRGTHTGSPRASGHALRASQSLGAHTPGLPEPQGARTQGLPEPQGTHMEFRSPKDKGAHLMHQSGSLSHFGS